MSISKRPVLVATDLSAGCDRVIDRAQMLASDLAVPLNIVHVIDSSGKSHGNTSHVKAAVRATMADVDADVNIVLPVGRAPEMIASAAEATGSGIIVTGVARHDQIGDLFFGSVVECVVRLTKVPVLVVKQRPHGSYRSVLVATDLSEGSRVVLQKAAEMLPATTIHLINARQVPFAALLVSHLRREDVEKVSHWELEEFLNEASIGIELRARISRTLGFGETEPVVAQSF